jgi:hypothetical protein
MDAIGRIAFHRGIRNEVPNQELARDLALSGDREGIRQIAEGLGDRNRSIASDCVKVLYEVGYIAPELVAEYGPAFVELLGSKVNRMVWGGMIALSTIAERESALVWKHRRAIMETIERGSVITEVSGLKALTRMAAANRRYRKEIEPFLLNYLSEGRPVDLPTRIEEYERIMDGDFPRKVLEALEANAGAFKRAQVARINRVLKRRGLAFSR